MSDLQLVIGDKSRDPWSLRAWLILKQLGLEFDEVTVPLGRPDGAEPVPRHAPSGKLPLLVAGGIKVWDALAIAEFLAERHPSLWPRDAEARALARAVSAEMHAGFRDLQTFLPFDLAARFDPPGRLLTPVAADLRRVVEIWTGCRARFGEGGPFLFGGFTATDAMYAPVCAQLAGHSIPLDDLSGAYVAHMLGLPAIVAWQEGALAGGPVPTVSSRPRPAGSVPKAAPARAGPERGAERPAAAAGEAGRPPPQRPKAAFDGEDEDDDSAPAPGLPGVVATRPYGDEPAAGGAAAGGDPSTRRPPSAGGLFRWRQPARLTAQIAGADHAPPPARVAPPPADAAATPAEPPAPAAEREEAAPPSAPAPKPPAYAPRPATIPRSETIKPIGDGTRRRR